MIFSFLNLKFYLKNLIFISKVGEDLLIFLIVWFWIVSKRIEIDKKYLNIGIKVYGINNLVISWKIEEFFFFGFGRKWLEIVFVFVWLMIRFLFVN